MTTEAKLKKALRDAMSDKPLSEINVTKLCETCKIHRQTFYYHYQDIYDLLTAIFLSEEIKGLDTAKTVDEALLAVLKYYKDNFVFLRSAYGSSASEFVDDFIYGKIMMKIFSIFLATDKYKLSKEENRTLARRYGRFVSQEYSHWLKNTLVSPIRFEKTMKHFITASDNNVLPGLIKAIYEERTKKA